MNFVLSRTNRSRQFNTRIPRFNTRTPVPKNVLGRRLVHSNPSNNLNTRYIWYGVFGLGIIGGIFVAVFWERKKKVHEAFRVKSAGSVRIGGNWSLVDDQGYPISSAEFNGKYVLLYFGFTFCPDICPEELRKMALVLNELDENVGPIIQPLFVSLDPWRDSTEQMANYVRDFHPRLRGLTGTPAQLEQLAKAYRVYTATNRDFHDSDMEDYVVDHSIFMYFMGPDGKFIDLFGVDKEPEEIFERIKAHLVVRGDAKYTLWEQVVNYFTFEE